MDGNRRLSSSGPGQQHQQDRQEDYDSDAEADVETLTGWRSMVQDKTVFPAAIFCVTMVIAVVVKKMSGTASTKGGQ